MVGYVAVTHQDWFQYLAQRIFWEEVNFWRPSAHHSFKGLAGTPFFFKLKAPDHKIGGFGLVAAFSRLPDWLAWESFGEANGAASFEEMETRLNEIRTKSKLLGTGPLPQIGCILLSSAVFFPRELWIDQPTDWAPSNMTNQKYDLESGEGRRIWVQCQERLVALRSQLRSFPQSELLEPRAFEEVERYGVPYLVKPRLGQGIFRVAVTDAYGRACAVTGEHSLPVLEASHIRPYAKEGPHEVANGLLLRADLHRLFDQGYLTVTPDHHLEVSERLRADYDNGRTYYPFHGNRLKLPQTEGEWPSPAFLRWHNENVYRR
jgi:putative restriction endonuclease